MAASSFDAEKGKAERILEMLAVIGDAPQSSIAVKGFKDVLTMMSLDSGVFLSVVRDDAIRTSYRSLLACDPRWCAEFATKGWHDSNPWLDYAHTNTEPAVAADLPVRSRYEDFLSTSAALGFASTIVVPAPSNAGPSRVGVLCLGSRHADNFSEARFARVRVLARALAMELHRWMLNSLRHELILRSRITEEDIELLRWEDAGASSKRIAAAMDLEATTIDSRFQRLAARMQAPDRRSAARVARLYGVL